MFYFVIVHQETKQYLIMLIKSTITVIDLKNIYIFVARNMLTQKCPYNSIVNNLHTTITLNDGLLTFLEKVWPFIITFY